MQRLEGAELVTCNSFAIPRTWLGQDVVASILRASTTLTFPRFRELCICPSKLWPCKLNNHGDNDPDPSAAARIIVLVKEYRFLSPNLKYSTKYEFIYFCYNNSNSRPNPSAMLSLKELHLPLATRNELSAE